MIVKADGTFVSDKAQTTPKEFEICFFAGLEAACESLGKAAREVLPSAVEISYGTTAGTNILVTRSDAPQIGFITTKGAEDRTHIGRFRAAGLSRVESMHVSTADKPAPLVSRELIRGVVERIGSRGEVVIPLREDSVKQAVRELLAQGVEGIAVGLLWSPLNQTHEKRVSEIIKEMAPGLAVTISSEIASTIREYPRFISAIVDLYIGKPMRELLNRIEEGLGKCGYRYPLLVLQAAGGVSRAKVVKPGNTLNSGPVGGLTGVEYFAWLYGFKGAVGSDVGGTSFDVCAAMPEPTYIRQPLVGRFEVANPMREISTIGAGGGTMARVDAITKRLTVGPESAGAEPGPVCYGRGGIQPTVTDADVVLNRINPNYFLGGKIRLDKDKALTAIKEKIADPLGLDPYQAAEAICRIIDGKMLIALQSFISGKGIDPATYPLISYGGAGPTHCAAYARGIGFSKIIIPPFAAVFSAWGASTADVRHMYEGAPFITIAGLPFDASTSRFKTDQLTSLGQVPSWTIDRFNSMYENLEQLALEDMKAEGVEVKNVIVSHECEARYGGQLWEIRMPLSVSRLRSAEDLRTILHEFERTFLSVYGPLSLFPRGGLQILKLAVVTASPTTKASLPRSKPAGPDASAALKGERDVYFDGRFVPTKIYDMLRLQPGNVVEGEAVIEAVDTTVVIPRQCNITMDEYMNLVMVYR